MQLFVYKLKSIICDGAQVALNTYKQIAIYHLEEITVHKTPTILINTIFTMIIKHDFNYGQKAYLLWSKNIIFTIATENITYSHKGKYLLLSYSIFTWSYSIFI